MPGWAWRDGRDSRRALGNGYVPRRRRGWHDRGREEKREAEELLKEATRNPQTSHRSTSFLIRSTYGMYPVAERSPCLRNARRDVDKSFLVILYSRILHYLQPYSDATTSIRLYLSFKITLKSDKFTRALCTCICTMLGNVVSPG